MLAPISVNNDGPGSRKFLSASTNKTESFWKLSFICNQKKKNQSMDHINAAGQCGVRAEKLYRANALLVLVSAMDWSKLIFLSMLPCLPKHSMRKMFPSERNFTGFHLVANQWKRSRFYFITRIKHHSHCHQWCHVMAFESMFACTADFLPDCWFILDQIMAGIKWTIPIQNFTEITSS